VALLLDTGIVYAYYDRSDRWHRAAMQLLSAEIGGLLLPGPVLPAVDHLLGARLGSEARRVFCRGLIEASFLVVDLPSVWSCCRFPRPPLRPAPAAASGAAAHRERDQAAQEGDHRGLIR
jgi:hypothetical protein